MHYRNPEKTRIISHPRQPPANRLILIGTVIPHSLRSRHNHGARTTSGIFQRNSSATLIAIFPVISSSRLSLRALGGELGLDVSQQRLKLGLLALHLEAAGHPLAGLVEAAHLVQAAAPPPPGLCVADALGLDAGLGVDGALGPLLQAHVRLGAVGVQAGDLLADELLGLPVGALEGHVDAEPVHLDGVAVLLLAVAVVAAVAELGHLGAALGVDGDRGRGRLRGRLERQERPVQLVERQELVLQRLVGRQRRRRDGLGLGVDLEGQDLNDLVHGRERGRRCRAHRLLCGHGVWSL